MSGHVVCLENRPETIQEQIRVIEKYDLQPDICERPLKLGNLLEGGELKREGIKAFVLDMHDEQIKTLAEIDLPSAGTARGEAVGLAVAERYLKAPKSPFRHIPIAFLTAYKIHSPVKKRIEDLKRQSQDDSVTDIGKKDLNAFERFIRTVVGPNECVKADNIVAFPRPDTARSPRLSNYIEGFDIAIKILNEFELSDVAIAALFGKVIRSSDQWENIARDIRGSRHLDMDIHDRSEFIIDIKTRLASIFGPDDLSSQRRWLGARQTDLDGKSPIALLKSAHQDQLAHVVAILRRITG